jgi:hypothetical protein
MIPGRLFVPAIVALALSMPTSAAAWTTQGGRTTTPGNYFVELAVGFPHARLKGHIPLHKALEINPFVTFHYWGDVTDTSPLLGNQVGVQIKFNTLDQGPLQVSLSVEPALLMDYWPDGTHIGYQFGFPDIVISYDLNKYVMLFGGVRVPFALVFNMDYEVELRLPIIFQFGLEYNLAPKVNLFGLVEMGPHLHFSKERPTCTTTQGGRFEICDRQNTTGGNRIEMFFAALFGAAFGF